MYHGEKLNAWTHLAGGVLALIGTVWLLALAASDGDITKIVSVAIYGFTLVLLYSTSTLYHSVRGRAKVIMQKLDHLSIYLLIAGSYTPFCLVTLRGAWGWWLFGIVWSLAAIGMLQEISTGTVDRDLRGHGLDRAGGRQTTARRARHHRLRLAARWRRVVYRGDRLLCVRSALSPLARYLAPVRHSG
jgi:hypothetical protein